MSQFIYKGIGIEDNNFISGKAPMTKQEVRTVSISKLKPLYNDVCIDIGAGTGSISIELGFICNKVYSVECCKAASALIKANIEHFDLNNIQVLEGFAPEVIDGIGKVNKAFVGGTKGNIGSIMQWLNKHLTTSGVVVGNFITLENAVRCIAHLKKGPYKDIDIVQINIAKGKDIGGLTMMNSNNPIYIISAVKE